MIKQLKEVTGKVKEIMYQQNADINKELENLKGNPDLFFSELKNTITEMESTLEGINSRPDDTVE